jgi:hypothetical protein
MSDDIDTTFLKKLAERFLKPDFDNEKPTVFKSLSGKGSIEDLVYAEDLIDAYSNQELGTILKDNEWDYLSKLVNKWNQEKIEGDENLKTFITREALFQEILDKCEKIPKYEDVEKKLGRVIAEDYLANTEQLENNLELYPYINEDKEYKFNKNEMQEIVTLIGILANGDKERIIDEYEQYKKMKRRENQEKREKIKHSNTNIIARVKDLGIWFPYPNDVELWLNDARIVDKAEYFIEVVQKVKDKMKKERCLLQYIPKRRLTNKTVADIDRNIQVMHIYLGEES